MERVVLDPAVLVSALISPLGNPAALWQAVRDEQIEIITSPRLLAELARVLARPKFRRYATLEEVEVFVTEVAHYGTSLPDPADPAPASRDPNDDYLVALARSATARALVSGDHDLTDMANADPPVLTPAAAIAQLL